MKNTSISSIALLICLLFTGQKTFAQGWTQNAGTQAITTNTTFNNTAAANVGIGTTTPTARLDILGGPTWTSNSWGKGLQLANGYALSLRISPTLSFGIGATSSTNSLHFFTAMDGVANPASNLMTLTSVGNLSLGNYTSSAKFAVHANSTMTLPTVELHNGTNSYDRIRLTNLNSGFWDVAGYIGATDGEDRLNIFNNAAGDVLSVTGAGRVGIGTINPEYSLDVRGVASIGGSDLVLGRQDGRPQKGKPLNRAMAHYAGTNPQADNLVINFDGDFEDGVLVGGPGLAIGAPWRIPSGYMLSVGGKVICEELKVQLKGAWPDYVFAEGYRLPPLEEVERHIEAEQHLPGVPSACEVAENGLSVGEMQTKMMEKIEELTLYLIELKKDNVSLRQEVETLKHKQ